MSGELVRVRNRSKYFVRKCQFQSCGGELSFPSIGLSVALKLHKIRYQVDWKTHNKKIKIKVSYSPRKKNKNHFLFYETENLLNKSGEKFYREFARGTIETNKLLKNRIVVLKIKDEFLWRIVARFLFPNPIFTPFCPEVSIFICLLLLTNWI